MEQQMPENELQLIIFEPQNNIENVEIPQEVIGEEVDLQIINVEILPQHQPADTTSESTPRPTPEPTPEPASEPNNHTDNNANESVMILNEDSSTPTSTKKRKRSRSVTVCTPARDKKLNETLDTDDGSICPVCLDHWEMVGPHRLTSLKCGHLFGESCIKRWLKQNEPGSKCCPSCKSRAAVRDLRNIYAKKVVAIDNTEECRLRNELDKEKLKNSKVQTECDILKVELAVAKTFVSKLQSDNDRLSKLISCDAGNVAVSDNKLNQITYKLFMDKNIDLSKEPGCRVMAYARRTKNLVISQKSSLNLFPGFGVRFVDVRNFRPNNFMYISAKSVRDLDLTQDECTLAAATMEKTAKLFSLQNRTVVNTFTPSDNMLWSCALDKGSNNFLYLGSQHGSTYVYDIRNANQAIEEFKNEGDLSPVVSICPVPPTKIIPLGGFFVCKLQSVWFYEYVASQQVIPSKLNVDGPFVALNYNSTYGSVLISTRPSTKHQNSRYILAKIAKFENTVVLDIVQTFHGSIIQPVMSRCTQINPKNDQTFIAAYLQDKKLLSVWDAINNMRLQSLPISDVVLDTCPIYEGNNTYLAALTACKCKILKFIPV